MIISPLVQAPFSPLSLPQPPNTSSSLTLPLDSSLYPPDPSYLPPPIFYLGLLSLILPSLEVHIHSHYTFGFSAFVLTYHLVGFLLSFLPWLSCSISITLLLVLLYTLFYKSFSAVSASFRICYICHCSCDIFPPILLLFCWFYNECLLTLLSTVGLPWSSLPSNFSFLWYIYPI